MATCQMVSCYILYSWTSEHRIHKGIRFPKADGDTASFWLHYCKKICAREPERNLYGLWQTHTPSRTFYPAILAWGSSNKAGPHRVNRLFLRAGETGYPPGSGSLQGVLALRKQMVGLWLQYAVYFLIDKYLHWTRVNNVKKISLS